jgi:phage terminase large subunit-like protein
LRDDHGRPLRLDGWQGYALDRVLACDAAGRLLTRTAIVSTARQNGKTALARGLIAWALDVGPWPLILGAAGDREQARIIYRAVAADVEDSPELSRRWVTTKRQGITGSRGRRYDTRSADASTARGYSPGLVLLDELLLQRNRDQWNALKPAMIAQRDPLLLGISNAGDARSVLLRDQYDRMVRIAEGAEAPDAAFVGLWWAGADDADPVRPSTADLRAANPAIAAGRMTVAGLQAAARSMTADAVRTEMLNLWDPTAGTHVEWLPEGAWDSCGDPRAVMPAGAPAFAGSVAEDWSRASIAAAIRRPDGRVHVELAADIRAAPGGRLPASRFTDAAAAILARNPTRRPFAWDARDPGAGAWARMTEALDIPGWPASVGDLIGASADLYALAVAGQLVHLADPLLTAQAVAAARVDVGEGWRISRKRSAGDVDALTAAMLAVAGALRPDPVPQLFV